MPVPSISWLGQLLVLWTVLGLPVIPHCSGQGVKGVRLMGGSAANNGRLEAFYAGIWMNVTYGRWVTLSPYGMQYVEHTFTDIAAAVACRQLGFIGGIATWSVDQQLPPERCLEVDSGCGDGCKPATAQLQQCGCLNIRRSKCANSVRLQCSPGTAAPAIPVRLSGGRTAREGRVEIFLNGIWGRVSNLTQTGAELLCRQTGLGSRAVVADVPTFAPAGEGVFWTDGFTCTGSESSVVECGIWLDCASTRDCRDRPWTQRQDSQVGCFSDGEPDPYTTTLRLVNGTSARTGRVEILYTGRWYPLSSVDNTGYGPLFDNLTAAIACRQMDLNDSQPRWTEEDRTDPSPDTSPSVPCASLGTRQPCDVGSPTLQHCDLLNAGVYPCRKFVRLTCPGPACPTCAGAALPPGDSGRRQVVLSVGAIVRSSPCGTSQHIATAPKCSWVTWTGRRQPSGCDEDLCYAEVRLDSGVTGWVQLYECKRPDKPTLDRTLPGQANVATCIPTCPACSNTTLAAGDKGVRQVVSASDLPLRTSPCNTSGVVAVAPRCSRVTWTGNRQPSVCNDALCYAEVSIGGTRRGWVPLNNCSSPAEATLVAVPKGQQTSPACVPGCPLCVNTTLAKTDSGRRQVTSPTGLIVRTGCCGRAGRIATVPRCSWITFTGVRQASWCGEPLCYAQVRVDDGQQGWVVFNNCSMPAASTFSKPPNGQATVAACHPAPCPSCTNTTLKASDSGRRQVTASAGLVVRSGRCGTASRVGTAARCSWVTWTGRRQRSECWEAQCYAEVRLASGEQGWAALFNCSSSNVTSMAKPPPGQFNQATCLPATCGTCSNTTLPTTTNSGRRQVTAASGLTVRRNRCSTAPSVGSAARCSWVTWTGRRERSACGEPQCYAQVRLASGRQGWAPLYNCSSPADTSLRLPARGQANAPGC